jgi:hypothetical protein
MFKGRLITELPTDPRILSIVCAKPELRVEVERKIITIDGDTLQGRIARLLAAGFFDEPKTSPDVIAELIKRGASERVKFGAKNELAELGRLGFLTRDNKWYRAVPEMKVNVVEK